MGSKRSRCQKLAVPIFRGQNKRLRKLITEINKKTVVKDGSLVS
jgi:hypothetical protein